MNVSKLPTLGDCYLINEAMGRRDHVCRSCGLLVSSSSTSMRLRQHAEGCFPAGTFQPPPQERPSRGLGATTQRIEPPRQEAPLEPEEIDGARFRLIERSSDAALP